MQRRNQLPGNAPQLRPRPAVIYGFFALLLVAGSAWPNASPRAEGTAEGIVAGAHAPLPLGAREPPEATTFSIWSPDTDDVGLSLEGKAQALPMARIPDTDEYTDVYRVTVPGD